MIRVALESSIQILRHPMKIFLHTLLACTSLFQNSWLLAQSPPQTSPKPNIILIMTDDQGWGQTGYYKHPVLKTPNLDAMAANGLRFDRFYAGAPVCSPTRASVLTGRANNRTGVPSHGHALRLQEKTIASALKQAGYATGHFGKWHLNGLRGPGAPILDNDPYGPKGFGFETWMTVTNFFDLDPLMGSTRGVHQFKGDSSEIIVNQALSFIKKQKDAEKPFLAVIWDGSPHSPFEASEEDIAPFKDLDKNSQRHYAELVAFDRSVGVLRKTLRDLDIAENTMVWFCSDNGGLPKIKPTTVGNLRGNKGTVYEGGLRVPAILEWPAGIKPRITKYPSSTMDIFPTIADLLELPKDNFLKPVDGESLKALFTKGLKRRENAIPFRYQTKGALVDNNFKLVSSNVRKNAFALYDLATDPGEARDISKESTEQLQKMTAHYLKWYQSVEDSIAGKDYTGDFDPDSVPQPKFWTSDKRYQKRFKEWKKYPGFEKIYKETKRRDR